MLLSLAITDCFDY